MRQSKQRRINKELTDRVRRLEEILVAPEPPDRSSETERERSMRLAVETQEAQRRYAGDRLRLLESTPARDLTDADLEEMARLRAASEHLLYGARAEARQEPHLEPVADRADRPKLIENSDELEIGKLPVGAFYAFLGVNAPVVEIVAEGDASHGRLPKSRNVWGGRDKAEFYVRFPTAKPEFVWLPGVEAGAMGTSDGLGAS